MREILRWVMALLQVSLSLLQETLNQRPNPTWLEMYHYPGLYTTPMTPFINFTSTLVANTSFTPDYRMEEKHYTVYSPNFFLEEERPYRLSPHYKQTSRWNVKEKAHNLACYCCTVYKRFIVLAGCAILTTRHLVTTATPTEAIIRNYKDRPTLEGILGAWYDTTADVFNSSLYATPARIHYHPMYKYDYEVNSSHPLPCMFDLAVWATTYSFQGSFGSLAGAVVCQRAASSAREFTSSIPRARDIHVLVGYLFMKAYGRRPLPWYKYGVRTRRYVWPCPKTEWQWFHCVQGGWAKFGLDSGAAMHFMDREQTWRLDGFAGMNAFSMKLRSLSLTHYFTVIDTHPVLDFFYDSYMGRLRYKYLDYRFYDTQWAAPRLYWGEYIHHDYKYGVQYEEFHPPNYRR